MMTTGSINEALQRWLGEVYGGRRWLIGVDVLQGGLGMAKQLQGWGAAPSFLVAARLGTGDLPGGEVCEWHLLDLPPASMMEAIRQGERALRDLPAAVQARIEAVDPHHEMQALGAFFSTGEPIGGRRFFGARLASWQALEDKVVIDALWDAAGVARSPVEVVAADAPALAEAAVRLDRGRGTVWAGDAREGFHGGAHLTFHVHDEASARRAAGVLSAHADRARVMPYLQGVPCSIHGVVFPERTLVLRPAEMVVLGSPAGRGFVYAGVATYWDPPAEGRAQMREVAQRVGACLRRDHGYRGAFTVDGVFTERGFLPTELNPRVGAAMAAVVSAPWEMLHYALIEWKNPGIDVDAWEDELLVMADTRRAGRVSFTFDKRVPPRSMALVWTGEGWRAAAEGERPHGVGEVGPGPSGGYARLRLLPDHTPVGSSVAPRALGFARWLNEDLGVGLEVRPGC